MACPVHVVEGHAQHPGVYSIQRFLKRFCQCPAFTDIETNGFDGGDEELYLQFSVNAGLSDSNHFV